MSWVSSKIRGTFFRVRIMRVMDYVGVPLFVDLCLWGLGLRYSGLGYKFGKP